MEITHRGDRRSVKALSTLLTAETASFSLVTGVASAWAHVWIEVEAFASDADSHATAVVLYNVHCCRISIRPILYVLPSL